MSDEVWGKVAFDAFDAIRWPDHRRTWESLPPLIREAWCAAAQAVRDAASK